MVNDLDVSRLTATKYLDQLVEIGLLTKERVGRSNYYINQLFIITADGSTLDRQHPNKNMSCSSRSQLVQI